MLFHLWSNLGLRTLHAIWPALAPAGQDRRSSAALAIGVRAVPKAAMEDLKLKFCCAMLAFSGHALGLYSKKLNNFGRNSIGDCSNSET
jgi:hypothetical protein